MYICLDSNFQLVPFCVQLLTTTTLAQDYYFFLAVHTNIAGLTQPCIQLYLIPVLVLYQNHHSQCRSSLEVTNHIVMMS